MTRFSGPEPDRFARDITVFTRGEVGGWHRDDERHVNGLVDVASVPARLAEAGVTAEVRDAFGREAFPVGLCAVIGGRGSA